MGGYCHGTFWYLPLSQLHMQWLRISVLELLATGFNAIVFARRLSHTWRVVFLSDALATPYVLSRRHPRSSVLHFALELLLKDSEYLHAASFSEVAHLSGDCNAAAGAVSRGEWDRFRALCAQIHVRPLRLDLPPRCQ
eukprot:1028913-Pleurochrysis_carterae.AAC.1